MKLCTETITVFNAALNPETGYDVYLPTVIRGVSWYCDIASTVTDTGLKAANRFTIRIPADADFSGKSYAAPAAFTSAADKQRLFTLAQGTLIIHGEEPGSLTQAQLQAKYGEVVTVLGVTDNRRAPRAKHWKVVGA